MHAVAEADVKEAAVSALAPGPATSRRFAGIRAMAALWLVSSLSLLTGCYLGHAALGQARLLIAREPIEDALRDPRLAPDLRARLALVGEVRAFASSLGLDVGARYTSFARWPGDRVVTTVVATPPRSLDPVTHWFPITGSVPYLGFFDPARAEREAERQRARGNDVCVSAVAAYSTLGWLDDPVVEPMLRHGDGWLVETLLHELVHHTAYVPGDAAWNEGLATIVGEEASVAFFAARALRGGDAGAADAERARIDDGRRVAERLARLREEVAALYAGEARRATEHARSGIAAKPSEREPGEEQTRELDEARARLERDARTDLGALSLTRADASAVAAHARLGDACLALEGVYTAELSRWRAAAERLRPLSALIEAAKHARKTPHPRTHLP